MPSAGATGAVGAPYNPADNPFKGHNEPPPSRHEQAKAVEGKRKPVDKVNG